MLCIYKTCQAVLYAMAAEARALGVNVEALWAVVYGCQVRGEGRHCRIAGIWIICWNIDPHSVAVTHCVIILAHLLFCVEWNSNKLLDFNCIASLAVRHQTDIKELVARKADCCLASRHLSLCKKAAHDLRKDTSWQPAKTYYSAHNSVGRLYSAKCFALLFAHISSLTKTVNISSWC